MDKFYNPVRIIFGSGAICEISSLLEPITKNNINVLMLVWNETVLGIKAFRDIINDKSYNTEVICFDASNPTIEQLYDVYCRTKDFAPSAVVAVGGGSVMDVGKSLCCLYGKEIESEEDIRRIIIEKNYGIPNAKWIGVPTTAGTGSEATCWATIWDPERDTKRSVESHNNYAYASVVDPDLTISMPVRLAVSSALDAVAHAVESYWAKGSNVVSQALAISAINMIMSNIEALIDGDTKAHEYMARGSMIAGMAFSNTRTTACHSISYPLTMHYHIPHGTAVSMLLAPVMNINQKNTENVQLLFDALGVKDVNELKEKISSILRKAGIPSSLREWKVEPEKIPEIASLGITKGRADNNPVEINCEMIEKILKEVF